MINNINVMEIIALGITVTERGRVNTITLPQTKFSQ